MNKVVFKISLSFIVIGLIVFNSINTIFSEKISSQYKYNYESSDMYEVDYINDDGSFSKVSSYSDFNSAKNKMKENKDYVVRCRDGYSPSRIVAMNSGLVYSYPRGTSSTQNLYQTWDSANKYNYTQTYVSRRYEMTYIDTPYMSAKSGFEGEGYVEVVLNGFRGFADIEYTDLVPSKYIDKGIALYMGGAYGSNSVEPYKVKITPNYYTIKKNGNYYDLEFHYHEAYPDSNGYAEEYTIKAGNAGNFPFLNEGSRYFSDDGINFYTDYKKNNKVGSAYNYYQFLPLRTKTKISGSQMNDFLRSMRSDYSGSKINSKGDVFVSLGDEYGCNGALIYALACQESAYGTSTYAVDRNNLFGWNAYDDSPSDASSFSSVDVAIKEHMGRNLRKYMDYTDSRYNGTYVGSKGSGFNLKYASDPYWGIKIGAIYYNMDKHANGKNGNLTDYNSYTLGLINTFGATIYADQNCSSALCSSRYNSARQQDNIVVVLEENANTYKIQFSNPISKSSGQVVTNQDGVIGYSWSKSVAYVKKGDITLLNTSKNIDVNLPHEAITIVDNANVSDNKLLLEGIGIITNYNFTNSDLIKHSIKIVDLSNNEVVDTVDCSNRDTSFYKLNDGFDYTYGGFKALIDLSSIDYGDYMFYLVTSLKVNSDTVTKETVIKSSIDDLHLHTFVSNEKLYKLITNDIYNYRFELGVTCNYEELDYNTIHKPSIRTSLATVDSVNYDDNVMTISGVGMVYYLNYDINENHHKLCLVNENNVYELNTNTIKSTFDFKTFYNSSYNMDYICYEASIDLSNVEEGTYRLVLKIANNGYLDICEIVNAYDYKYLELDNDNYKASFSVGDVRDCMLFNLEVKEGD